MIIFSRNVRYGLLSLLLINTALYGSDLSIKEREEKQAEQFYNDFRLLRGNINSLISRYKILGTGYRYMENKPVVDGIVNSLKRDYQTLGNLLINHPPRAITESVQKQNELTLDEIQETRAKIEDLFSL